ncbi:MAG: hypothetical protein K6E78_01635 [Treponema sp.]|nr:hypothetical protein [Treponema sp.]
MIFTFFFYTFFSSAVLLYGIGLNSSTIICDSIKELTLPLVKVVATVFTTAVLCWLVIRNILVPLNLVLMYPFIAILIFFAVSIFFEVIIRITSGKITSDFNISFLIILLTLNESSNILEVLMISFSAMCSFFFLLPLMYALKHRIDLLTENQIFGNRKTLILLSVAMLIIILSFINVSWLNPGVMK